MMNSMKMVASLVIGVALGASLTTLKLFKNTDHQPYADEQGRTISSLSAKDVSDLRAGKGWGLAKPAEFNGYPGPAHVLELADELNLTDQQHEAVQASFEKMQSRAAELGLKLIDAEKRLDAAFVENRITNEELMRLLSVAEHTRAGLRAVHLSAHLQVSPLLSDEQKKKYADLRGYGSGGHEGHGSH